MTTTELETIDEVVAPAAETDGDETTAPVSVVIPCYRCRDTIERALESIDKQSLRPFEVILVEDASRDGTLRYLRDLQSRFDESWIQVIGLEENGGPATARNVGWDAARGDFVAFLDSDDSWHPEKIRVQYEWMRRHPQASISSHAYDRTEPGDECVHEVEDFDWDRITLRKLLVANRFPTRTVMLRTDLPFRFAAEKRHSEDYLLWLDIVAGGKMAYRLDVSLAYRYKEPFGDGGLSGDLWKMEQGELDALRRIRDRGAITAIEYGAACCLSLAKYGSRVVRSKLRSTLLR